jgi:DNA mismatch repair protein MutL
MTTLVERLQRCANPMHCPHGRPTIVRLEPDRIAKLFKRIQITITRGLRLGA